MKVAILEVEPNKGFSDASFLPGARLHFSHLIENTEGISNLTVTMSMTSPLSWLWKRILGKDQQSDLERSAANLIAKAENRQ